MTRFTAALIATLALSTISSTEASTADPVLTLDVSSQRLNRSTHLPILSIYADGRVDMPAVYPHAVDVSGRLTQSQLRSLLDFVAVEQNFFAISQAEATRNGVTPLRLPVHAPRITLAANFDGRRKTITFRALERHADHVDPRLVAVHSRLKGVMAWIQVGGTEGLKPILALVNSELAVKSQGRVSFSASDLTAGKRRSDGSIYATFRQQMLDETWSAAVERSPTDVASVSVSRNIDQDRAGMERTGDVQSPSTVSRGTAGVAFVFDYVDPAGVGFNDAALGGARRQALQQAAQLLSNTIITDSPATVTLTVDGAETLDGVLAGATSAFNSVEAAVCAPGFGNRGDVGIIVLGGSDPAPGDSDGSIGVNFEDHLWDLDDNVAADRFDFKSTMLHELMHALGFSNTINEDGTDPCGTPLGQRGGWAPFDEFIGDEFGFLINDDFRVEQDWLFSSVGGSGNAGLLWLGQGGTAASDNNTVPMFSPRQWQEGSSVAHLDDTIFQGTQLMESASPEGPGIRTLSAIELGILQDLGFNVTMNVIPPEPPIFADGFESGN